MSSVKGGVELSVRTVVILIMAIVVLIAVVAFFMGSWGPGTDATDCEAQVRSACLTYVTNNCCDEDKSCHDVVDGFEVDAECEPANWDNACC